MPNVAGVQFPYTPQGQEAAQLYERSLSPSRGLGFRPIRMDEGGDAEAKAITKGLTDLMSRGTNEQVVAYVNKNRLDLIEIAKIDDTEFDVVRLMLYGDKAVGAGGSQTMEDAVFGAVAGAGAAIPDSVAASPGYDTGDYFPPERPLDQREALRAMGESNPIIAAADEQIAQNMMGLNRLDIPLAGRNRLGIDEAVFGATAGAGGALGATGLGRQEALRAAGTQPYLYGPSPPSEQFDDTTALRSAGQYRSPLKRNVLPPATETQMTEPQIWEFEGMRHGGPVQGMAYGGVPRGTVAGELEPRGYLTARQAGETMRERAKGLRDRRNYGGGIGSLYNRYG